MVKSSNPKMWKNLAKVKPLPKALSSPQAVAILQWLETTISLFMHTPNSKTQLLAPAEILFGRRITQRRHIHSLSNLKMEQSKSIETLVNTKHSKHHLQTRVFSEGDSLVSKAKISLLFTIGMTLMSLEELTSGKTLNTYCGLKMVIK